MADQSVVALAAALAMVLLAYQLWRMRTHRQLRLPPSPRAYPLVGHLLSMPTKFEHVGFTEIGKALGCDMFSLTTFGTTIVVLNKMEDAINLLEKRSSIYSDRVCPRMLAEPSLLDWRNLGVVVGYNNRWRAYRRLMNPWLHKKAAEKFRPWQTEEAKLFLQRLLNKKGEYRSSKELADEVYWSVASIILRSVYGYQPEGLSDPFVVESKTAMDNLTKAFLASNFMVNLVPGLVHVPDWLPGTSWKQTAHKWRKQKEDVIKTTYGWAKARHNDGANEQTIIDIMINQALSLGLSEDETDDYVQQIAITLLAGGTDTSTATLMAFFVAMLLFPDVQTKAQKEIDAVIGLDRLPNLNDQDELPYVRRVVLEVLRWFPVAPLAIPHVCFQDDVYKGYDIPKGAVIMGNVWAMTRDPDVYKSPESFDPDRFLDPSVPPSSVFGWGRRFCPGIHFAQASLFILIASFLATFDIKMAKDEDGQEIAPSSEMENTIVLHPGPFKCMISPRSAAHKVLIQTPV